jgi:outer membrane protein
MNKIVFLLLIFLSFSFAGETKHYSLRIAYGVESDSDLGEIITFQNPTKHSYDFDVISLDGGYLLGENIFELPLDLYLKGGIAKFGSEDLSRYVELKNMKDVSSKDVYEFTFYIKLYYKFLDEKLRLGFGEGGSYVTDYLAPEVIEEHLEDPLNPKYSKYLNYLDISFDIDLGRIFSYKPLNDTYLGYTLKHRSGIFGLINGVSGGSNYNTISIERKF